MKSRRQRSMVRKTSSSRSRSSSSLDQQVHCQQQLPMDLMIDIFSRLSLKSIATCRCVSKHWASVLGLSHFTDLHLKRSQARPRLLLAVKEGNKVLFLSSPQPQSPDENMSSSSSVAADHHICFSFDHPVIDVSTCVSGFFCVRISGHRFVKRRRRFVVEESVLCNPSTGQSLPKIKTRKRDGIVCFLGYDPVEKLHKVLAMIGLHNGFTIEHQVLTLGGGGGTWRMTKCDIPCDSSGSIKSLCINGVLYYIETVTDLSCDDMIMCFDVRTEKFSSVESPKRILYHRLVDCNGKLGLVARGFKSETVEMWVLQDPERHEWSKRVYMLPTMWKDVVGPKDNLKIVGVTGRPNEFVMSRTYSAVPFHVYYCDFDKGTVTRVVVQGVGVSGSKRKFSCHTYVNHVEDVKLMEL